MSDITHQMNVADISRQRLRILIAKRTAFGYKDTPDYIHTEIVNIRKEINAIRREVGINNLPIESIDIHEQWYYDNDLV